MVVRNESDVRVHVKEENLDRADIHMVMRKLAVRVLSGMGMGLGSASHTMLVSCKLVMRLSSG